MTLMMVFLVIILFVFAIVDTFAGLKAALITAVALALVESALSVYMFKEIDAVTVSFFVLVVVLAAFSWKKNSPMAFRFKPVILSAAMGFIVLGFYMAGHSLVLETALKYRQMYPPEMQALFDDPTYQRFMSSLSWTTGLALILHGALTAWAALKLNRWWWAAIGSIGQFVFLGIAVTLTSLSIH